MHRSKMDLVDSLTPKQRAALWRAYVGLSSSANFEAARGYTQVARDLAARSRELVAAFADRPAFAKAE